MKYKVTNISRTTYIGSVKIKPNETIEVTKSIYIYLEKTFGKFNIFEFSVEGQKTKTKSPKTKTKIQKEKSVDTKSTPK